MGDFACSVMDQNPIFRLQRHNVGDGPKGDQVEPLPEVEIRKGATLEKGMAEFEDEAHTAEIVEDRVCHCLRINDGNAIREFAFWLVMIEHDHIRTPRADAGNFVCYPDLACQDLAIDDGPFRSPRTSRNQPR
jgi:hypothetical protein